MQVRDLLSATTKAELLPSATHNKLRLTENKGYTRASWVVIPNKPNNTKIRKRIEYSF